MSDSDPLADLIGAKTYVYQCSDLDSSLPPSILVSTVVVGRLSYLRVLIPEIGLSFSLPWTPVHRYMNRLEDEGETNSE